MKEHPIIFNSEMVNALLGGRKTQTRRVVKLPNAPMHLGSWQSSFIGGAGCFKIGESGERLKVPVEACIWHTRTGKTILSPYGKVGSLLWVRETFVRVWKPYHEKYVIHYKADNEGITGKWKPSIHMPRWASRITLEITNIRIERVQEITRDDCIAEGIAYENGKWRDYRKGIFKQWALSDPKDSFRTLWDSINLKRGCRWDVNPWVWVIEFKKLCQ